MTIPIYPVAPRLKAKTVERREALLHLRRLLKDVPGAATPWVDINDQLHRVSARVINAIVYRIEAVCKQSFDDGFERGRHHAE